MQRLHPPYLYSQSRERLYKMQNNCRDKMPYIGVDCGFESHAGEPREKAIVTDDFCCIADRDCLYSCCAYFTAPTGRGTELPMKLASDLRITPAGGSIPHNAQASLWPQARTVAAPRAVKTASA